MRWLFVALPLAGCATPPIFPECPPSVAIPAPLPRIRTMAMLDAFEIRVELAREAERRRGDACAAAVVVRDVWIAAHPR